MDRKPPSTEFNEVVKAEHIRQLRRHGFMLVLTEASGTTFWKHKDGRLLKFGVDHRGHLVVIRLDNQGD